MKTKAINIIFFTVIFFLILSFILLRPLNNLDEIWIFNVSKNIVDGRLIYKDISMVAMPLAYQINALALNIFGNELIVLRFVASLIAIAILFIINKICLKLNMKNLLIKILLVIITGLYINYFCADYNFYSLLNILFIMYLELIIIKKFDFFSCSYLDIILGMLAGVAILLKQSIGLCVAGVLIFYKILWLRKKDLKIFLKLWLYRGLGCISVVSIIFIYLIRKGVLYEFFDYTILSLKTFSNSIPYYKLFETNVSLLAILACINIVFAFWLCFFSKKSDYKLRVLIMYSLVNFIMVFPISGPTHFLIAFLPNFVLIIYIIINKI